MKVIYVEYLPEKVESKLSKDHFIYHNSDDDFYLVTDNKYKELEVKYNLSTLEEDGDKLCCIYESLEDWIDMAYEQEYYTFFEKEFAYCDVAEIIDLTLSEMVDENKNEISFVKSDDWTKDVKEYLLSALSDVIKIEIEESLIKAKNNGIDIAVLKMAFSSL